MIICVCHRVSDRDIARAVQQGCASFDELQFDLAVATCCGKCGECARETFEHHVRRMPAAAQAQGVGAVAQAPLATIAVHRHPLRAASNPAA